MRNLFLVAVFSLLPFISFSAVIEDFVVVKVNNRAITNSEILDRYRFAISASKINIKSISDQKILRLQVIDKMIDEELIRQEAKNLKLEASEAEIKDAIEVISLQRKQKPHQFKLFFTKNNLSFDAYLKQIEAEILWSKIISEILRYKLKITDAEVREFFEQHKFNTNVKKFFVAEILISQSENAAQFANKLAIELRQGADFKNIVQQFSTSFTSENNGELGWISQADIDQKIYAVISKLGKGDYSDPVLLSDGYHIFTLLDAKTETKIHDQDLNAAKNAIFNHKLQSLAKGYLMDLRKKAFVEIHEN